jgi:WXXGXW repeat (2 copies)
MKWATIAAGVVLFGIGTAVAQPPPPPGYAPIPAPRYEAVPPAPGPRVIWEPGHWHWDGVRYVWIGGRYVEARPHYHHYAPGRWVAGHQGRWVWVPAHWE